MDYENVKIFTGVILYSTTTSSLQSGKYNLNTGTSVENELTVHKHFVFTIFEFNSKETVAIIKYSVSYYEY